MWNMSHPDMVPIEEYVSYDLVLVASEQRSQELMPRLDRPVHSFLQCTDTEEFYERRRPVGEERRGLVFVGNTRDERREGVIWAVEEGFPLRIWGRGWDEWLPTGRVVEGYLPNETLGELYSRSRVSLNDHWPDMKQHGYINNRIFDALACGLPVVSDRHAALEELFPDEILYYSDRQELVECLERCLLAYPAVERAARRATGLVRRDFSFEERARRLLRLVCDLRGERFPDHLSGPAEGTATLALDPSTLPRPRDDARWCPVCETYSDAFGTFGVGKRPDARCPNCGALERHRSAWLFLRAATDLLDGGPKRLLHLSPEAHLGRIFRTLPGVRYWSCDLQPHGVSVASDLTRLGFADASVDCIYCSHVLEHIEDDAAAMGELFRILRPGGWAFVMTPIRGDTTYEDWSVRSEEGRLAHFGQCDHVRIYGRDLQQRLEGCGFEVSEHDGRLGLSDQQCRFMGLRSTFLYHCVKPRPVPSAALVAEGG
jgi:rubrerythrin